MAQITAEGLNTKNLLTNLKGSLFYSLDQKFPISIENPKNKSIDISYRYIPEPITKGLSLSTRLEHTRSMKMEIIRISRFRYRSRIDIG